jgi:hypothetical protein
VELLTEYYMWTEIDKEGNEGSIAALAPDIGWIPLITRKKEIAIDVFRALALAHQKHHKNKIRLIRWTEYEVLEAVNERGRSFKNKK